MGNADHFDVLGLAYKGQRNGACASSCIGISEGPGGGAVTIVDARNPGSWPRHPAEELASNLSIHSPESDARFGELAIHFPSCGEAAT